MINDKNRAVVTIQMNYDDYNYMIEALNRAMYHCRTRDPEAHTMLLKVKTELIK